MSASKKKKRDIVPGSRADVLAIEEGWKIVSRQSRDASAIVRAAKLVDTSKLPVREDGEVDDAAWVAHMKKQIRLLKDNEAHGAAAIKKLMTSKVRFLCQFLGFVTDGAVNDLQQIIKNHERQRHHSQA